MQINNTVDFQMVFPSDPEAAEQWLAGIRADRAGHPQYNDRWVDHRERELFNHYCGRGDFRSAKRIVESTLLPAVKVDRKKRLEELSGTQYDQI